MVLSSALERKSYHWGEKKTYSFSPRTHAHATHLPSPLTQLVCWSLLTLFMAAHTHTPPSSLLFPHPAAARGRGAGPGPMSYVKGVVIREAPVAGPGPGVAATTDFFSAFFSGRNYGAETRRLARKSCPVAV